MTTSCFSAKACGNVRIPTMVFALATLVLSACSVIPPSNVKSNARLTPSSRITRDLTQLPAPLTKIAVAVYGFRDQTGQFKPSPDSSYSTSVTQGAASVLVKALKDSGWYLPVEREGLQNLLTERKIARAIESPLEKGKPLINLPNLLPASLIIEGGVIAFESNVRTGGKGASYLGIGSSTQYHVDQVTVILRGIDIRTGQVLNAVSVTKTIYSYQFSASLYKFTSYQQLLQGETGFTTNEPAQLAVREAIEAAVIHLTVQGIRDRYLELKDERTMNSPVIQTYLSESVTNLSDEDRGDDAPIGLRPLTTESQAATIRSLLPTSNETAPVKPKEEPSAQDAAALVPPVSVPAVADLGAGTAVAAHAVADKPMQANQARVAAPVLPKRTTPATATVLPAGAASDDIFKQYWRN